MLMGTLCLPAANHSQVRMLIPIKCSAVRSLLPETEVMLSRVPLGCAAADAPLTAAKRHHALLRELQELADNGQ